MMLQPIEVILYALLLVLGIGAAMVLAVLVINMPSKRARAARRRKY
jgi:prolipoprotein diacylglyceryltransferase